MGKNKEHHVLLIAMSGVRVKDKELLELGMTLPGFVDRSRVIASLPSLSLLTLAAYCPKNWHPTYLEIDDLAEHAVPKIVNEHYNLVAISSLSARIYDAYALSDRLREFGLKVVLGGLHVSALPDEAASHADVVVQGEAEIIWPKLLEDFERGELRPQYSSLTEKAFVPTFKNFRVPRYDLLDIRKYNRLTLQTSRGCPRHCTFCAASRTISRYKLKPVEQVARELDAVFELWWRPFIELADDNTFVNKKWSRDLVGLFKHYPMKWFTEADISVADDLKLLELLSQANCAQLLIGLESAVPASLTGIDRNNWKRRQFDTYREKIERIQSFGISVNGCFILGLDCDDERTFGITKEFIRDSTLSEVQITILTPFPGTLLYERLKLENRLLKQPFWDECTLFDVTYKPLHLSSEALRQGFRELMQIVYSPQWVAERKQNFRKCRRLRKKGGNYEY